MTYRRRYLGAWIALLVASQACNLGGETAPGAVDATAATATPAVAAATDTLVPPTETPIPPTATVTHLVFPGEPGSEQFFLADVASGGENSVERAAAGDNFARNRLERPFLQDLTYRPDLDLVHAGITADDTWTYFNLDLYEGATAGPQTSYAVELDLDRDGRGDWMVRAVGLSTSAWTTDGVRVWSDANRDVGGARPLEADPADPALDGYETLVFDQGVGPDPDLAWARLSSKGVQFAVKRSQLAGASFLWGVWADEGVDRPDWIDYNDHFSAAEAGSLTTAIGSVAAVDNTCRMYFGFTPTGSEPGLCSVTGTVRNCSPHPMRMEPGAKMLTPWFEAGAILKNVPIGTYRFYDESTGGTLVLTASLSPGGTITITKTGLGDTYPCQ